MWLPDIALLNPKGTIALLERGLMLHAVEFMLIVALPVLTLLFFFAWRYRERPAKGGASSVNHKESAVKYEPNWERARLDELIWWAIPFEIVLVLGALTWTSTHELDPRKPLESNQSPLVVQVVALDWKWLFIYPEEKIATVNYLAMPVGRPVRFEITADAPMNSFWIPKLGGQIYAMTGMLTQLNLIANEPGKYPGMSANYSGEGFAQMKFVADAKSQEGFDAWVADVHSIPDKLTWDSYQFLREPTTANGFRYYGDVDTDLQHKILESFAHVP
jgi:cytochrome o ubiquinol oxidase subunit 2